MSMLVRITNQCQMGCSHCLVDSKLEGVFMEMLTFERVMDFTLKFEHPIPFIQISGGEPTEHPQILDFADLLRRYRIPSILLSNGMFLEDEEMAEEIINEFDGIQITNDPRFYPKRVPIVENKKITYEDNIQLIAPFGRAIENKIEVTRQTPMCFNLRSIVRTYRNFPDAINALRQFGKFCTPSIEPNGEVVAGETPFCTRIGDITSEEDELMHAIYNMQCDKCGLVNNLDHTHKLAIGESRIFLP